MRPHHLLVLLLLSCTSSESERPEDTSWQADVQTRLSHAAAAIQDAGPSQFVVNHGSMVGRFGADGLRVAYADEGGLALIEQGWGRVDAWQPLAPTTPEWGACIVGAEDPAGACIQRLEYVRPGLTSWWEATPGRLEQGWDIDDAPAGDGPLAVTLLVEGAISMDTDGETAFVTDTAGRLWTYGQLSAWDATGEPLDAWLEVEEARIHVMVDDTDAVWPITIDPVLSTAANTYSGVAATNYFGYSVAALGDVNGDGYNDLGIGAHYAATNGRVYVYHGSAAGLPSTSSSTLTGLVSNDHYGQAIAAAGDVNGDGYDDIVVGAPDADNGGLLSAGKAYVHHGSAAGLVATATTTVQGSALTDYMGFTVDGAGDVNGDGYDDIIVGAYQADTATANVGKAFVYLGSATGVSSTATTTIAGTVSSDNLGYSVAGAGDVNGDGYDDVLIGARTADSSPLSNNGKAYLHYGSSAGPSSSANVTFAGGASNDNLSWSLDGAGDVNADGYDDIIIGAYRADITGGTDAGKAYIYHGGASGPSTVASTTLSGAAASDNFGWAVSGAGDINADGYDDVIVGAPFANPASVSDAGSAYIYEGSASGITSASGMTLSGITSTAYFGRSVAGAGDVNADGYDDVVVGEPYGDPSALSDAGSAYVYYGYDDDDDRDGYASPDDCDDTNAAISPSAIDIPADGIDQDCDGQETCYIDADNDGYRLGTTAISADGDCNDSGEALPADPTGDCNDNAATVNPGMSEVCDSSNVDEDCDGTADDADTSTTGKYTWYQDGDSDGYGTSTTLSACEQPSGYASMGGDCNDANAGISPGDLEVCDPSDVDEDCDGAADDSDGSVTGTSTFYRDADADTYGSSTTTIAACNLPSGYVTNSSDCNDGSASIRPGGTEVCDASNTDEDCDGTADDADASATGKTTYYRDVDADSYGTSTSTTAACDLPSGYATVSTDCNDSRADINPGGTEVCDSSNADEDCDGAADDADASVSSATYSTFYTDDDSDGLGDPAGDWSSCDLPAGFVTNATDCDDTSAAIGVASTMVYADDDGDSFGDAAEAMLACAPGGGFVTDDTDCDDGDVTSYPGAYDVPSDGIDQDCSGEDAFPDHDSDGQDERYDCDDYDPTTWTGAGYNESTPDLCRTDADGDGYGDPLPSNSVAIGGTDCNDADASISPGATEITSDSIDQDCSNPYAPSVLIDNGATYTNQTTVTLSLSAMDSGGVTEMCLSTSSTCTTWVSYATTYVYSISSSAGTRRVYAKFRDADANESSQVYDTIIQDRTGPINGTLSATATDATVSLSWSGFSDSLSGVASYTLVRTDDGAAPDSSCTEGTVLYTGTNVSFVDSGLTNGTTYGYRVCATDTAGNTSSGAATTARPAPEFVAPTGAVEINDNAAWTKTSNVTLRIPAVDPAGVSQMCISNTTSCSSWQTYASPTSWSLSGSGDTRTVYVWLKDAYGNATTSPVSDSIGFDATRPVNGTLSATSADSSVVLNWTGFTDTGSGIAAYTVVMGSSAPTSCTSGTVVYTGSDTTTTVTGLTNGSTYGFRVCATDLATNASSGATATAKAASEMNPPTGTVVINSDDAWTRSAYVTLTMNATDDTSVSQMCVSNSTSCSAWETYATTKSWTLSSGRTVYVWFRDPNNNTSTTYATDAISYDATKPINGTLTAASADNAVNLSWSGFSDATSGIASYTVVMADEDAPSACNRGTVVYTGADSSTTISGLTNGLEYGFRICATDAAGNQSSGVTATAKAASELDAPTGTLTINSGDAWTQSAAVNLTISATDASGVTEMCVSNTAICTSWEAYGTSKSWTMSTTSGYTRTVYIWFKDPNNNVTASPITDTIGYDRTRPTNGTLTATASVGAAALSWSGVTDAASGVASYTVVYAKSGVAPSSCSTGTVGYTGTSTSTTVSGLLSGSTYSFRMCATDVAGNVSSGATASVAVP